MIMNRYDKLNPPQKEAVFQTEGPVLILAGAGSGKTRVLTYRIAFLIAEVGIAPWNILAITFTNKAANEMRERVDKLIGTGARSVWVSTFHSLCVRILRRHIEALGYQSNFVIYDTDDQKSLMKDIMRRQNIDTKVYKEKGLLARISHAKDDMISPDEMERDAGKDKEMLLTAKVYREYQAGLRSNNALDFDDLLVRTVELFEKEPEILAYYQERFRYIMVDEYQDTNQVQFRFVSLLAKRYRNLCVVGDDDQSIYKFRGANIYNILNFEDEYPDAVVIRLEQNYRSTGNILSAANEVISHNTERKEKTLWTAKDKGSKIHFRQFFNGFEEAEYVVGEIAARCVKGGDMYRDFAVLYRTNAQSRLFEEKMIAAGIPYKIIGGINFYSRKEIKDILCYLRTIDNANDDLSVSRIINVPKRGIGATTLSRVQDYAAAHQISLFTALEKANDIPGIGRGVTKLKGFVDFIRMLRTKAEILDVRELIDAVMEDTGYLEELRAEGTDEAKARIENLDELVSTAASYLLRCQDDGEESSLSGFMEEIALVADIDRLEDMEDYVPLMTLHSAKGLEFPCVFMVGMDDGVFPGYGTINYGDDSDMQEERRLCYVGITRAMRELTMTSVRQRMTRGEVSNFRPSRFIYEIPRELMDLGYKADAMAGQLWKSKAWQQAESVLGSFDIGGENGFGSYDSLENASTAFDGEWQPETPKAADRSVRMPASEKTSTRTGPASRRFGSLAVGSAGAARPKNAPERPSSLEYGVGDMVRHIKFGTGQVKDIKDGGRDYEITVEFEKFGTKKMFAGFAKLKKV